MTTQRSVFHISPSLSPKLWPSSPPLSAGHADIGFAHDADGERLGIVTELGEPQSEEIKPISSDCGSPSSVTIPSLSPSASCAKPISAWPADNGGELGHSFGLRLGLMWKTERWVVIHSQNFASQRLQPART